MTISLPIELWGLILLNNSIEESVKFIQQCAFLSLFSNEELYYLKSNFIIPYIKILIQLIQINSIFIILVLFMFLK